MVSGINEVNSGIGYQNTSKVKKGQNAEENVKETSFSQQVMKCTSAGGKKTMLCQDALFSMASFVTGESVNVYKADGFSEENPVYLVKGIDSKGNEYEQTINVSDVNPNSCTFLELSVLNAHVGAKGTDSFMQMAIAHSRAGNNSFFDRENYNKAVQENLKDYRTMKAWDSYLRCNNWWQGIMDYYKSVR